MPSGFVDGGQTLSARCVRIPIQSPVAPALRHEPSAGATK
jgi:hypothetical protein